MYTLFLVMSFVKGNAWRMVSLTAALFFVLATLSSIITPCQGEICNYTYLLMYDVLRPVSVEVSLGCHAHLLVRHVSKTALFA